MTEKNDNKILNDERYSIVWAVVHPKGKRYSWNIGVCGYCWKPCFPGTDLEVLSIHEVYVNTAINYCEEAKRCFNVKCKFNRSTIETIAKANNWSEALKKRLKKKWKNSKDSLIGFQEFADECRKAYTQDPKVSVVEIGEEKYDE
jgi:hypothetical protein